MSSDESFVWTSASEANQSDGSYENLKQKSTMKIKEQEETDIEAPHETELSKSKKEKKRNSSSIDHEVFKVKRIKYEEDSDIDSIREKVKLKQEPSREIHDNEGSIFDESYLNLRVKKEQVSHIIDSNLSPKKKKRKSSAMQSIDIDEGATESGKSSNVENGLSVEGKITVKECDTTETYADSGEDIGVEHSSDDVKHKKKKKKHRKSLSKSDAAPQVASANASLNETKHVHERTRDESMNGGNGYESEMDLHNDMNVSAENQNSFKLSDSIRFEDDISHTDLNETSKDINNYNENVKTKLMKHYLKKNTNLQPIVSKTKSDSIVTDNDDIWLMKCPRDIDIVNLRGVAFNLERKTKLKINGNVYDSFVESTIMKLPILTYDHNKPLIKNTKLNGCIILRNKVPKVHIAENGATTSVQTNFIQLPETKCRHPLFGANYKKLIKVSSKIAARLTTAEPLLAIEEHKRNKKKKHKKERKELEREMESMEEVKFEEELPSKKKKKKKRTHSLDNDSPVKAKRVKHDPNCAQTWESEKAIEATLFNF